MIHKYIQVVELDVYLYREEAKYVINQIKDIYIKNINKVVDNDILALYNKYIIIILS